MKEENPRLSDEELAEIGLKSQKTRNKIIASGGSTKQGETAKYMRYVMERWDKAPIDITDAQKVERRIKKYFSDSTVNDMKPTLMGICNSLGITKTTFQNWLRNKDCTIKHCEIAQKAMGVLEEFWEMSVVNGKIPTDIGKFLGERQFGYTSVSELIITPNNPLDPQKDEKELRKIYGGNVVRELDEKSVIARDEEE